MSNQPAGLCHQCGAPLDPAQRFCSNCGSSIVMKNDQQTKMSQRDENTYIQSESAFGAYTPPPPPPYSEPVQYGRQQEYQPQPTPGAYQTPPPSYAMPAKDSSKSVLKQIGCGFLVIILIILALCAGGSYLGYRWVSAQVQNNSTQSYINSSDNGQSPDTTKVSKPVTTSLHTSDVLYAGVNISIVDVQQATGFTNDNTSTTGVLRLNINEKNISPQPSYYFYSDMMLLQLPDGSSIHPLQAQFSSGPDSAITRTNWIDFPVPTTVQPSQVTLIIGQSTEAQISIPLKSGVDLSKYQPKSTTINKKLQPESASGASWTITSVTTQTSYGSTQAATGKIYVVVSMKIDNNSSTAIYPFANDNMRLQAGTTKSRPDSHTLPDSIAANQTNAQGVCVFVMPADSSDFTFSFSPDSYNELKQEMTASFQLK